MVGVIGESHSSSFRFSPRLVATRIVPRYDFADVSLEFLWTFAEDDGIYECVATNPYGEDRTRAELKCRPKRSIIYNTQLPGGMEGVSKLQMLEDEMRYVDPSACSNNAFDRDRPI